jgi:hypothetical protein
MGKQRCIPVHETNSIQKRISLKISEELQMFRIVRGNTILDIKLYLIHTYQVCHEKVRNEKRNGVEYNDLDSAFCYLLCIPGHAFQLPCVCGVTVNPVLNLLNTISMKMV